MRPASLRLSEAETASLRDAVYARLKRAILDGQFRPGERLTEAGLASQLAVSRSPVREAVRRLEAEGLLVVRPRVGTFLATFSLPELLDLWSIRESLEGLAARQAIERASDRDISMLVTAVERVARACATGRSDAINQADTAFHLRLAEISKNRFLVDALVPLVERSHTVREYSFSHPARLEEYVGYHRAVADAIRGRDLQAAERAVVNLFRGMVERLRRLLAEERPAAEPAEKLAGGVEGSIVVRPEGLPDVD